jgi:hypothetical protein
MGGRSARPRSPSMDPSLDPNQNGLARGVLGEAPKETAPALGDAEADII